MAWPRWLGNRTSPDDHMDRLAEQAVERELQANLAASPLNTDRDLLEIPWQTQQTNEPNVLPVLEPDPASIELLFLHSHALSSIEKKVRQNVWRQGLQIESRYAAQCHACGHQTDRASSRCPKCGDEDSLEEPDEAGRRELERFMEQANLDAETLEDVGRAGTSDSEKHGRFTAIHRFRYLLDESGNILSRKLVEVRRSSPGYVRSVLNKKTGRRGGKYYVCLRCRSKEGYTAEKKQGPCHHCGAATHDAWYIEVSSFMSNDVRSYYLPGEVYETTWHYEDGTAPVHRVWHMAWFLIFADHRARQAFDPRGKQTSRRIFVVVGGDAAAIRKWVKEEEARYQKYPYGFPKTFHIPNPSITGSGNSVRNDAKVLDLGDALVEGQVLELRKEFKEMLREEFGISQIEGGDATTSGGLNSEGLQIRIGARPIQYRQRRLQRWLDQVARDLGVLAWRYSFEEAFEEDAERKARITGMNLLNARAAADLGLKVRWEDDDAVILEGDVVAPDDQLHEPLLGLGGGFDPKAELQPGSTDGVQRAEM